ncbi:MAG: nicotinamide riboside transporter PnuC [Pseudomonadota bacterium]
MALPQGLELAAALLSVAYLVLAIRQSLWCWPCAFVSTSLYVYLFGLGQLYMESALNVFYLIMAMVGFWRWRYGGATAEEPLPVSTLTLSKHLLALAIIAVLIFCSSSLLATYTDQALPVVDSFTTWMAVWATWLTAQKVLENWAYWLVIDVVSIGLYLDRGFHFTAALFVVYVVLIPFGWMAWRRSLGNGADHVAID